MYDVKRIHHPNGPKNSSDCSLPVCQDHRTPVSTETTTFPTESVAESSSAPVSMSFVGSPPQGTPPSISSDNNIATDDSGASVTGPFQSPGSSPGASPFPSSVYNFSLTAESTDSGSLNATATPSFTPTTPAIISTSSPLPSSDTTPSLSNAGSSSPTSSLPMTTTSPQEALVRHSSHVGAIAGGVVGGVVAIALMLGLLLCGKRMWHARGRHRVAPSAEFLGRGAVPFSPSLLPSTGPQMRAVSVYGSRPGSRVASPFGVPIQGNGRSQSIYRDDEAAARLAGVAAGSSLAMGSGDELPPPFTAGNFSDPLFEKLSDAARQREELYRTTIGGNGSALPASPLPQRNDSGDTYGTNSDSPHSTLTRATRESQQGLYNPYLNTYPSDSEHEEDLKATSPILSRMSASHDGMRHSMAGEIGWAV